MEAEERKITQSQRSEAEIKQWIEKLCADTWREVYRFIYYKVGNREEAEDITQETYAKAMVYLRKEYAVIENHSAFLKTIALNILKDKWRKQRKEPVNINLDDLDIESEEEDFTQVTERRQALREALDSLKEEQRRVVELRILKGYSVKETAGILKKKEATIRVLQLRALKKLALVLQAKSWQ